MRTKIKTVSATKAWLNPVMNPKSILEYVKIISTSERIPSIIPAIVRGCLILFLIPHPIRTNRTELCLSLTPQPTPPMTTSAVKLANSSLIKSVMTTTTNTTVEIRITIEKMSFQRLVRYLSFIKLPLDVS